jgi:GNAT superfamily N-acetyltransferase
LVTVEFATTDDMEPLAQLFEELVDEKTDLSKMSENFKRIASNPDYILLTAKEDGQVAGSVMGIVCLDLVGKCKPFMVIENVIVSSTHRGRGIGTLLMNEIENIGRRRNCFYTMFVSAGYRKEAHQFYKGCGYDLDLVQGFKKYL